MNQSIEKIRASLKLLVGQLKSVKLYRHTPCEPVLNGFLLGLEEDWGILWQFAGFEPNGFVIFRLDGLKNYRCDHREDFWTDVVQKEGVVEELPDIQIDLSSIETILGDVQRTRKMVIIESEDRYDDIQDFYIGQIIRIQKTGLKFANFDVLGKWDENPTTIGFDEITKIQLGTHYADTFARHTSGACPFKIRYP